MQIGTGPRREPEGISDLLLACHERIRRFIDLARRLAASRDLGDDEVRDVAEKVRRYFAEALPRHVDDEEETVLPRLRGRSPELDTALARMRREHSDHEPHIESLLTVCTLLASEPARLDEVRATLRDTAAALARELEAHLRLEEAIIVPAIARLIPADEQTEMLAELRARRG